MPNSDLAPETQDDDVWGVSVTEPADNSSQFPILSSPPAGSCPPTDDTISSYSTLARSTNRNWRSYVWDSANGHEYRHDDGKIRWRCSRCTLRPSLWSGCEELMRKQAPIPQLPPPSPSSQQRTPLPICAMSTVSVATGPSRMWQQKKTVYGRHSATHFLGFPSISPFSVRS